MKFRNFIRYLRLWLLPFTGFAALVWFLIRVIPKPSRSAYPCQRVAFPIASGFIVWLLGLAGSIAAFRKAKWAVVRARYVLAAILIVVSVGFIWMAINSASQEAALADPPTPNDPIGTAKGIYPGRVVWIHDPNATNWAGPFTGDGRWWEGSHTSQEVINDMMQKAICTLAGEPNLSAAWDRLFRSYNQQRGAGDVGYQAGEKIMIKVNFVYMIAVWGNLDYDFVDRGNDANLAICSPQIIRSLLDQLVNTVGVQESEITIGDPICLWCNEFYNMIHPDFPNVCYLDYLGQNGRTQIQQSDVNFFWSTTHADGKIQDKVIQSYVDANYLINLASLKGHYNQAGITGCGKNHYGSIRRPNAPGNYYDMHSDSPYSVPASGSYRNMVDLMGHNELGGKTFLCLMDGLYSGKHAQYSDPPLNQLPRKWLSQPFNNDWPSSIFASQDQVAMDSVGFDFLLAEWPDAAGPAHAGTDDFLHEAAQADNPPSGTFYDPERDGNSIQSLGVHEHWNDANNKQYSRNFDPISGIGIQLIKGTYVFGDFEPDGDIDFSDFAVLAAAWKSRPGDTNWNVACDIAIPRDELIDESDLAAFCENWLK